MTADTCSIAATAPVVSSWIAWTRREMSSVARAVSWARSFTSDATTAKPLPASPARAASIVALSARRFVCCVHPYALPASVAATAAPVGVW
ncbi:hypothetical protein GCM10027610_064570 [Dactylosporangium cerinum]